MTPGGKWGVFWGKGLTEQLHIPNGHMPDVTSFKGCEWS